MSQIQTVQTIRMEVNIINSSIKDMATKKGSLVDFILSDKFLKIDLTSFREFNKLLHEWVSSLIVLLKDVETPVVGETAKLPQPTFIYNPQEPTKPIPVETKQNETLNKLETVHLTVTQGAIIIVVNLAVTVATLFLQGPLIVPVCTAICSLVLTFVGQIAEVIKRFLAKKETKETAQDLRHWISKSVAIMRKDYTQRRFLIMQQKSNTAKIRLTRPADDAALYDLKTQSEETLAQKFLSTIDWIDTECNDAAFKRKQFLLSLLESKPIPQSVPVLQS